MGQRAAKDDNEKRGHDRVADGPTVERPRGVMAEWYDASPDWHPAAERWYLSLAESGQSIYYQQSDAAQAWVLAEALSRGLGGLAGEAADDLDDESGDALDERLKRLKMLKDHTDAQLLRIWLTGSRELLTTESARRGAHVRLEPIELDAAGRDEYMDDMVNVIKVQFGERTG